MKCKKCGQEFTGKFCPNCGTPANNDDPPKTQKKGGCLKVALIVVAVLVILMIIGAIFGEESSSDDPGVQQSVNTESQTKTSPETTPESENVESSDADSTPAYEPVDLTFGSGNYTAGIDFPAGTYDIIAVSGSGNVSSDNQFSGGINAMMGIVSDPTFADLYEQEYKNITLPEGTVLSISGFVQIQILCDAPESGVIPREQPNTETVDLSNGNFVAGEDFPAGVYDIVAISGGGNVSSDNMFSGGINAVMGIVSDPTFADMYEQEYKNISLPEGTTISIDGVEIQLIPSK